MTTIAAILILLQTGPTDAEIAETLEASNRMISAGRWTTARSKVETLLGRKDLPGAPRAEADYILAQCLENAVELQPALDAASRSLAGTPFRDRAGVHVLKARVLAVQKDTKGAVAALVTGLEEVEKAPEGEARWTAVDVVLYGTEQLGNRNNTVLAAAEAQAKGGSAGLQAILGVLRLVRRDYKTAIDALEKARATWKNDLILLKVLARAVAWNGDLDRALLLRGQIISAIKTLKPTLGNIRVDWIGSVNLDMTNSCIKAKNETFARKFAGVLASEPIGSGSHLVVGDLLAFLKDEAFIEQIDAVMITANRNSTDETARFYAHDPAAFAWRKLGKVEKAVALYRPVTEANGWSKNHADLAIRLIAEWEKEAKKP